MDRRKFLSWVGVGCLASYLPVVLAACSAPESKTSSSPANAGPQTVGTVADLDSAGQLLKKDLPVGPVLVIRNAGDPKNLVAVNPTCTHRGCVVAWEAKEQQFACPCHGARFDSTGKVLKGPAGRPLKTYQVTIEGDAVLIAAGP